ncbi:MAG: hypothetical protein KDD73_03220 [Anaerolineales bacterium]|nr:hypothetical protein [Anaerolineales bacterium]MCB9127322.1 hypothetical protein [Ardenticatenales bacterium]
MDHYDMDDIREIDLFAEDVEDRLHGSSASASCVASGTSISSAGSCWCSFSTIGCACTAELT